MDVLIKDSSLPPTNCYGCRFFKEEHYKDVFQDREYDVIGECLAGEFQIEKPYSPYDGICPLVELPPHGELKDVDKLLLRIDFGCCGGCHGKDVEGGCAGCSTRAVINEIKDTCTVLEANNGADS